MKVILRKTIEKEVECEIPDNLTAIEMIWAARDYKWTNEEVLTDVDYQVLDLDGETLAD
jgi:hypothetical protein